MDISKAIQVLIEAAEKGQKNGSYNLKEADVINQAIKFLTTKPESKQESVKTSLPKGK